MINKAVRVNPKYDEVRHRPWLGEYLIYMIKLLRRENASQFINY